MNKNRFGNIMLMLCFIAIIVIGFFIVSALDHQRFALERLENTMKDMESKFSTRAAAVPSASATAASARLESAVKMANSEFYDPKADSGGRFITATAADSKNMNTVITNDSFVSSLWSLSMDSLAARNYADIDKFEPQLAESWKMLDGGLRYRFKLRKGILWHDFTDPVTKKEWKDVPLTSADFKFYIDVIKNEKVDAAPLRTYLQDLDRIEVIDDLTFDVVWKKKYFLSREWSLGLSPLPRHLYHAYDGPFDPEKFNNDHERNRLIVGVGPYRFDRWDKGRRIIMKRWEKYYGRALGTMPPIETLSFDVIQHPGTRMQALVSQDLDETNLSPDQWINRANGPEFDPEKGFIRKSKRPSLSYNYIGFNFKNPVFADAQTRIALSHLVDKEKIVKDIYYGLARPVTGPFFPDSAANDPSIPLRKYDPETAKRLLAGAGWKDSDGDGILERNGVKLKFTLIYPNANPSYKRMLPMIKESMAKAGVRMDLLGLEWSVCVQRLENKTFDACAMGWLSGITSDPYQLWHSSQADAPSSSNMIGFKNAEADALIEEIRVTFDTEKLNSLYHRFHKLIYDEAPYIFMVSPFELIGINSRYNNFRVFPLGYSNLILWTPKAEQMRVPGL